MYFQLAMLAGRFMMCTTHITTASRLLCVALDHSSFKLSGLGPSIPVLKGPQIKCMSYSLARSYNPVQFQVSY